MNKKMKILPKTKLKKFRNLFEEQKRTLLSHQPADLVDDCGAGDEIDIAQNITINAMIERLSMREKESLHKISEAIKRLDDGSFGLCEECEEPISEKRLLAIPYCTTCIACAEQQERIARQYR